MMLRTIDSDGNTCDGACNACDCKNECEEYNEDIGCKIDCRDCFYWSGGCEA